MALVHADRVKETSTTTGTGTYTLAGAVTGFQSFAAIGDTNTCYYTAEDGTDWESGIGTYTSSGTTLARTTILASSNAGSAVNWGAGTRNIFVSLSAERTAGKQSIWVPAQAMYAPSTAGATFDESRELATNDVQLAVWKFATGADAHVQFNVAFPKAYDLGTVTFKAYWTTSGAVTTGIACALQALARADNEAIDAAWGTAVVVTDDAQSTADELLVTAESGAVTTGSALDDLTFFRFFRDVSDANDDMTQDMELIGIMLFFTNEALVDD